MTIPEGLKIERRRHVLEITIDRPKANAITVAMSRRLGELFREFEDDPSLRVAILTAAGQRFFSAGWDISEAMRGLSGVAPGMFGIGGFGGLSDAYWLTKPIIVAVNGACFGGMTEAMLGADFIVASTSASFDLGEARIGFAPRAASIARLLGRVPRTIANEMLLLGRTLDTNEALAHSLISAAVPPEQLLDCARSVADQITATAPLALKALKYAMTRLVHLPLEEIALMQDRGELESFNAVYRSEDAKEGPRAFIERRAPVWRGR